MYSNITEETASCNGTEFTLVGATNNSLPFSASFANGQEVHYVAIGDNGKCAGVGIYNSATNKITQDDLWQWTFGGGVNNNPVANLALTGFVLIRCDVFSVNGELILDQSASHIKTLYESNNDTNEFTDAEKANLGNQSGTNTGDQDISGIATNANAISDLETNKQNILAEGAFEAGDKTKLNKLPYVPSIKPTLKADFANNEYELYEGINNSYVNKPFDEVLTITNGAATGIDARGRLAKSAANKPRLVHNAVTGVAEGMLVEEQRVQLATFWNTFTDSSWAKFGWIIASISEIGEDGALSATKMRASTVDPYMFKSYSGGAGTYTVSIRARGQGASIGKAMRTRIYLDGVPTTLVPPSDLLEADSKDFTVSYAVPNTLTGIRFDIPEVAVIGDEVVIERVSIQVGAFATSRISSTDTFVSRVGGTGTRWNASGVLEAVAENVERISYNPNDLTAPPVQLNEVTSTNLFLNSAACGNQSIAVTIGQVYTFSFYGTASIAVSGAAVATVVGSSNTILTQYTFTAATTTVTLTKTGTAAHGQLENLPYATSRIVTTGAAVIRNADVYTSAQTTRVQDKPTRTLGAEFNPASFGVLIRANYLISPTPVGVRNGLLMLGSSLANRGDSLIISRDQGLSRVNLFIFKNNSLVSSTSLVTDVGVDKFSLMLLYSGGEINVVLNGVLVATVEYSLALYNLKYLVLGNEVVGFPSCLNIQEVNEYPIAPSLSEAIALTKP